MTTTSLRLPLGKSDFALIREQGCAYVDKTPYIYALAQQIGRQVLLMRPRRFGKTLLLSTFEALFRHGNALFEGLAIYELWRDRTYSTVRIDFSECQHFSNFETFEQQFTDLLALAFGRVGFRFEPRIPVELLQQLETWLKAKPNQSLVLLIDEYDAPITQTLDRSELHDKVRQVLRDFYELIRRHEAKLRFFFVSGITLMGADLVKAACPKVEDISLDPSFNAILGFTVQELEVHFKPDAQIIAIIEHYGGYRFALEASERVCTPWSVLHYLARPQAGFVPYWIQTGGVPDCMVGLTDDPPSHLWDRFDSERTLPTPVFSSNMRYVMDAKCLNLFLYQAGYLTIDRVKDDIVTLTYPNREIKSAVLTKFASCLLKPGASIMPLHFDSLYALLEEGCSEELKLYLIALRQAINTDAYPITNAISYRKYLQLLFTALLSKFDVRVSAPLDRNDLILKTDHKRWRIDCLNDQETTVNLEAKHSPSIIEESLH